MTIAYCLSQNNFRGGYVLPGTADPGFLVGGRRHCWGQQHATRALFGGSACEWGGSAWIRHCVIVYLIGINNMQICTCEANKLIMKHKGDYK